ncbi:MAG: stage II sporulation protein R [Clostridiales bacterium]|nr:stage II sporulation protein R [Clostridiales bacterium]
MKSKIVYIVLAAFGILLIFLVNFTINGKKNDGECIRLHIRANSDRPQDQALKYKVKDEVLQYLTPRLANCHGFDDVYKLIYDSQDELKDICARAAYKNGYGYGANVSLKKEYFPTRYYDGYTLKEGVYTALIIDLGRGEGDNWWCVIYPPLCFLDAQDQGGGYIKYKSKIYELIKQWKKEN